MAVLKEAAVLVWAAVGLCWAAALELGHGQSSTRLVRRAVPINDRLPQPTAPCRPASRGWARPVVALDRSSRCRMGRAGNRSRSAAINCATVLRLQEFTL